MRAKIGASYKDLPNAECKKVRNSPPAEIVDQTPLSILWETGNVQWQRHQIWTLCDLCVGLKANPKHHTQHTSTTGMVVWWVFAKKWSSSRKGWVSPGLTDGDCHTHPYSCTVAHMPRLTLLLMRISLQLAPTSELSYLRPKKSCFPAKPAVWQNHTNHRTKINKVSQIFIRSCIDHAMRSWCLCFSNWPEKDLNREDIRKVSEDDWALDGSTYDAYSNFFCSAPQVKLNENDAQFEFLEVRITPGKSDR